MSQERRRHFRVTGPFDGWRVGALDMAVQIYDLSEGGCFLNSVHEPPELGRRFMLRIELPGEPAITLQAETLYARPEFGYAVRFPDIPADTQRVLRNALLKLRGLTSDDEPTRI